MGSIQATICSWNGRSWRLTAGRSDEDGPRVGERGTEFGLLQDVLRGITRQPPFRTPITFTTTQFNELRAYCKPLLGAWPAKVRDLLPVTMKARHSAPWRYCPGTDTFPGYHSMRTCGTNKVPVSSCPPLLDGQFKLPVCSERRQSETVRQDKPGKWLLATTEIR